MEIFNNMNEEAQELVEIFNKQLGELSADGNTKVVAAFITLSHIMGKEIQILREEQNLMTKRIHTRIAAITSKI